MTGQTTLPVHRKWAEVLRSMAGRINGGEWPPGTRIPPKPVLRGYYQASDSTIQIVLQLLVERKAICRQRGLGYYVQPGWTPDDRLGDPPALYSPQRSRTRPRAVRRFSAMTEPRGWAAIAIAVVEQIASGKTGPGEKLPTREILAARFGVDPATAAKAVRYLAERGILYRPPGLGYYASPGWDRASADSEITLVLRRTAHDASDLQPVTLELLRLAWEPHGYHDFAGLDGLCTVNSPGGRPLAAPAAEHLNAEIRADYERRRAL